MKCPNCEGKISVLSKTVNTWSKERHCPHCQAPIEMYIPIKGQLVISGTLASLILLDDLIESYIGLTGLVVVACVVGFYIGLSSLRLKSR